MVMQARFVLGLRLTPPKAVTLGPRPKRVFPFVRSERQAASANGVKSPAARKDGSSPRGTGFTPAPARINSFPRKRANSKSARYAKASKAGTQKRGCAGWTDWPPIAPDRAKQADKVPFLRMDGVTG